MMIDTNKERVEKIRRIMAVLSTGTKEEKMKALEELYDFMEVNKEDEKTKWFTRQVLS